MEASELVEVFDRAGFLERMEGDLTLAEQVVQMFLDELPGILSGIHVAAAHGDGDAVASAAHKLKGSAITVGFSRVGAAALELEELAEGRQPGADLVTSLVARLEAACEEAREVGERFCLRGTPE